jgi:sugar transferase (PEP-CTERM/EpsH1 system associated)
MPNLPMANDHLCSHVTRKRRIVHVMYSFGIGGLENVIVQLVNRLPVDDFEHIVVSLTTISEFRNRILRPDVRFIALDKPPGHALALYPKIYKLLRDLKPDVLHTCNLAALEIVPLAWLASVHAEHGWDAHDPDGSSQKYRFLRRLYKPFVSHYVAVSKDIADYLLGPIGVPSSRLALIPNGVDTSDFAPKGSVVSQPPGCPFSPDRHWLIGTVGRLQTVKNQQLLARAFVELLHTYPATIQRCRLIVVGEGPLRNEVATVLLEAKVEQLAWLAGARDDVSAILPVLDCFVLPSMAEGTSCTLQEALSCGLPVVATAVGGTPDLVVNGVTGYLVPSGDVGAMTTAIWRMYSDPVRTEAMGVSARLHALANFALSAMIERYAGLVSMQPR